MIDCKQLDAFLADPSKQSAAGVIEHLETCARCSDLVDASAPTEALCAALAESKLDPSEEEFLRKELETDRQHQDSLRAAVRDVLLPSLSPATRRLVEQQDLPDLLLLDAAIEGVSTAIYSHDAPDARVFRDGSFQAGERTVPASATAEEIAQYADLYESGRPGDKAFALARWMYAAANDNPYLFRHFRALPEEAGLRLLPTPPAERVDDSADRWKLAAVHQEEESLSFMLVGFEELKGETIALADPVGWQLPNASAQAASKYASLLADNVNRTLTAPRHNQLVCVYLLPSGRSARMLSGGPKIAAKVGGVELTGRKLDKALFRDGGWTLQSGLRTEFIPSDLKGTKIL